MTEHFPSGDDRPATRAESAIAQLRIGALNALIGARAVGQRVVGMAARGMHEGQQQHQAQMDALPDHGERAVAHAENIVRECAEEVASCGAARAERVPECPVSIREGALLPAAVRLILAQGWDRLHPDHPIRPDVSQ